MVIDVYVEQGTVLVLAPWRRETHPSTCVFKRGIAIIFCNVRFPLLWGGERWIFGASAA